MDAVVVSDFRVEGRRHQVPLLNSDDPTGGRSGTNARKNLDGLACLFHPGCANEDGMQRGIVGLTPHEVQLRLEAVDLSPEGVATHRDVDATERLLTAPRIDDPVCQHDHACAGAERGKPLVEPRTERFEDPEGDRKLGHRGRLTAGQHDPVDALEFFGTANETRSCPTTLQGGCVLADITLEGKNTNHGSRHKGRVYKALTGFRDALRAPQPPSRPLQSTHRTSR